MKTDKKVLIIGGGAAGMACSVFLARAGIGAAVAEKNEKLGKKLYITGKGRCNFTNACGPEEFLEHVVSNRKFLYSAAWGFTPDDALELFRSLGLKIKIERGGRAFPVSDHSSDVIKALSGEMKRLGVEVHLNTEVERGTIAGLLAGNGHVVLATGGLSYPSTGSTGDGYRFAEELGLGVTDTRPSLVALTVKERETAEALEGLSLRNVTLFVKDGKKELYRGFGEMLFTHTGISGPLVLSASAKLVKILDQKELKAFIDLKPALTEEKLDARILREFENGKNKQFGNVIAPLFPAKLLPVIVALSGISRERQANSVKKSERGELVRLIKHFPLTLDGHGGFNEAVITQGGIRTSEIDPHTMRVKKYDNLYAIGEVLDVDALTGGFNLQIAWSTAYLAAQSIIEQEKRK